MSFTIRCGDGRSEPELTCDDCGGAVCVLEDGDDLEIIVRTAADHADECTATGGQNDG